MTTDQKIINNKLGLLKLAKILYFFIPIILLFPCYLNSATFTVSNNGDSGVGSLRQAISDANANGDPSNTININSGLSSIVLSSPLPIINKNLTITPLSGTQVVDGQNTHRGFFIKNGTISISNINQINSRAKGGDGGCLY